MAKENEYLQEAAQSLYVANADEIVRQQCIARELAERRERTLERDKRILAEKLEKQTAETEALRKEVERLKALLENKEM